MAAIKPPRPVVSPHGIPVSCLFYGHDVVTRDYKDANKIKTLDVHPSQPWVATADEAGNVCIWDYESETVVLNFAAETLKEGQRTAVEAWEAHTAFATAQGVPVPDVAGPGLGNGIGIDPGAASGSGTESFISSVVGGARRRSLLSTLPDDVKTARIGHVRAVKFIDDAVLAVSTGAAMRAGSGSECPDPALYDDATSLPLAATIDEVLAHMSSTCAPSALSASSSSAGMAIRSYQHAPQHWLVIMCEQRVLILDYSTRAVVDVPHAALLVEAAGPNGLGRNVTRGRPGVHSCAGIGPGVLAFGCEDGCIRIWNADLNAVVQTVKLPTGSSRPITHLHAFSCSGLAKGSAAPEARLLLLSGCADGTVNVWEVIAGRQIADNGRGGVQMVRLGGELMDVSVNLHTQQAVALAGDRSISMWDVSARPPPATGGATAGSPRIITSRIVTSSAASETGVGSKMLSAASLGAHPFFSPTTVLVASKGPHLELAVAGCTDKAGENGIIFYDLRTARPGLPAKCKVYVLSGHPLRPDVFTFGTNIGVFVVQVAPHYNTAACTVSHPRWIASLPADAGNLQPRDRLVTVYVNPAGALVAADAVLATKDDTATDAARGEAARPRGGGDSGALDGLTAASASHDATSVAGDESASVPSSSVGGRGHALPGTSGPFSAAVDASAREYPLLPLLLPPILMPAATTGPGSAGNPNAMAAIAALLKPGGAAAAGGVLPGTRGVRLRLSGSGRYLAAVWPEYRCYAIYRLTILGDADGEVADPGQWRAELVDSGGGLDIAWSTEIVGVKDDMPTSPGAAADDASPAAAAAAAAEERYERYAVVEPGIPVSVKPVYGGGMPIGSAPPAKGKGKGPAAAPPLPHFPNTLRLQQIPIVSVTASAPKPTTILAEVPLPQEPVAVWSGPVLAIALASDTGVAATSTAAALASASLQFFGWNVYTPEKQAEPAAGEPALSYAAKKAKEKAEKPRLPVLGATTATPPPSAYAAANGMGVIWDMDFKHFAVCGPAAVHVFAVIPGHAAGATSAAGRRAAGVTGELMHVIELGRLRTTAISATWADNALIIVGADGVTSASIPPLLDTSTGAGVGIYLQRRARRLLDVVSVPIQRAGIAEPSFPELIHPAIAPHPVAAPVNAWMSVALGIARSAVVLAHWMGGRASAPAGAVPGTGGVALAAHPISHGLLRGLLATSSAVALPSDDAAETYLAACSQGANWVSCLPQFAQDAAAPQLLCIGCPAAALLLPALSPAIGIPIALSLRAELQAQALASFAAVDIPVAIAYLRRVISECSDIDLMALSVHHTTERPTLAAAEALPNNIGVWAQVAAFLALSSALLPAEVSENNKALHMLVARCSALGLKRDAMLAAAVVHARPASAATTGPIVTALPETDRTTAAELIESIAGHRVDLSA